ncbi:MAG: inorganic diphosphatase [Bacilli bacterium]|nr:inorganic diphosphatase [Bacilli bacterium]
MKEITNAKDFLGKEVEVIMDRKLGTLHPKHGFIYMLNYGYIPNTISPDGEELDAYVLGCYEPVDSFKGKVIAYIHRINDDDDKLVVAPINKNYTDEQIIALTEFQERFFESQIIREMGVVSNYIDDDVQIYNKLVRDKIPDKIKSNGENPIINILDDKKYKNELEKKLYEEYKEVIESSGNDRLEELADMLEVIKALVKLEGKTLDDVIEVAKEKVKKRGSFDKKIYLEKVITKK